MPEAHASPAPDLQLPCLRVPRWPAHGGHALPGVAGMHPELAAGIASALCSMRLAPPVQVTIAGMVDEVELLQSLQKPKKVRGGGGGGGGGGMSAVETVGERRGMERRAMQPPARPPTHPPDCPTTLTMLCALFVCPAPPSPARSSLWAATAASTASWPSPRTTCARWAGGGAGAPRLLSVRSRFTVCIRSNNCHLQQGRSHPAPSQSQESQSWEPWEVSICKAPPCKPLP